MVYQMPCPAGHLLFVASTLQDETLAEGEIVQWAQDNGYLLPQNGQSFVIYEDGAKAHEWRLVERNDAGQARAA